MNQLAGVNIQSSVGMLLTMMYVFCRVMNQLAGVNIQSSVGMFTMSRQSLTYAESFDFLLLLHNFCHIFCSTMFDFICKFYFLHTF